MGGSRDFEGQSEAYFQSIRSLLKNCKNSKKKNSRVTGNIEVNYYKIIGQRTPKKFCNRIEKLMRPHDWNEALFNAE